MPAFTMVPDSCQLVDTRVRGLQRRRTLVYSIDLPESYLFSRETFAEREHAERYLAELRRLDPELPRSVGIEEHELVAGGAN